MRIAAVQLNAQPDGPANLAKMTSAVTALMERDRPDLIVFPEYAAFISIDPALLRAHAEPDGLGEAGRAMAALAARHHVNIHLGSVVERRAGRCYNTSLIFGRDGATIARYSKIHRFDVILPDGTEIEESAMVDRGDEIVVVAIEGVNIGLSICYDLRFGELYRALRAKGADVIVVPAAFQQQTGIDHWEVLLRARAIETQCYVVAPCQIGSYEHGARTNFAHSMIVDPWGLVIAQARHREEAIHADIDLHHATDIRARLPVHRHRVLD